MVWPSFDFGNSALLGCKAHSYWLTCALLLGNCWEMTELMIKLFHLLPISSKDEGLIPSLDSRLGNLDPSSSKVVIDGLRNF